MTHNQMEKTNDCQIRNCCNCGCQFKSCNGTPICGQCKANQDKLREKKYWSNNSELEKYIRHDSGMCHNNSMAIVCKDSPLHYGGPTLVNAESLRPILSRETALVLGAGYSIDSEVFFHTGPKFGYIHHERVSA